MTVITELSGPRKNFRDLFNKSRSETRNPVNATAPPKLNPVQQFIYNSLERIGQLCEPELYPPPKSKRSNGSGHPISQK